MRGGGVLTWRTSKIISRSGASLFSTGLSTLAEDTGQKQTNKNGFRILNYSFVWVFCGVFLRWKKARGLLRGRQNLNVGVGSSDT